MWDFLTPTVIIGAACGLLGAARSYFSSAERDKPWRGVTNLALGAAFAASACDYFVPDSRPLLAIPLAVVTGAAGGYVLDALTSSLPQIVVDGLRAVVLKWAGGVPAPDRPFRGGADTAGRFTREDRFDDPPDR